MQRLAARAVLRLYEASRLTQNETTGAAQQQPLRPQPPHALLQAQQAALEDRQLDGQFLVGW
jgi:hypothetical protein